MDNQQERLSLAWLAGVVDGEGSIGIWKSGSSPRPILTIYNNDNSMMRHAEHIIRRYTGVWIGNPGKNRKDALVIQVSGFKRVRSILTALLPYLVTKHEEAKLVLDFIASRMSSDSRVHTKSEQHIIEQVKRLKQDRILNDYTPNSVYIEKI